MNHVIKRIHSRLPDSPFLFLPVRVQHRSVDSIYPLDPGDRWFDTGIHSVSISLGSIESGRSSRKIPGLVLGYLITLGIGEGRTRRDLMIPIRLWRCSTQQLAVARVSLHDKGDWSM